MSERDLLRALTNVAVLNAVVLSLVAIQFVLPFAVLLSLWLVPSVIALKWYFAPPRVALVSSVILLVFASILFGPDIGLWTAIFIPVGSIAGLLYRASLPPLVRGGLIALTFVVLLLALVWFVVWLTSVDWRAFLQAFEDLTPFTTLPLLPALGIGFALLTIVLGLAVDWLLSRILRQLQNVGGL